MGDPSQPFRRATALALKCLALDAATTQVVREFERSGVPSILLKGRAISERLYATGPLRAYGDVDLLVPRSSHSGAERTLARMGFAFPLSEGRSDEGCRHASSWMRADGVTIDLHRTLAGVGRGAEDVWDVLAPHREVLTLAGVDVNVLAPAAQALVIALHAANHVDAGHHTHIGEHVAEDLRRALELFTPADWQGAHELAQRLDAVGRFAVGLNLTAPDHPIVKALVNDAPALSFLEVGRQSVPGVIKLETLAQAKGLKSKGRLLLNWMIPSRAFIRFRWPFAARGRAHLAAGYLWHGVYLTTRFPRAFGSWVKSTR